MRIFLSRTKIQKDNESWIGEVGSSSGHKRNSLLFMNTDYRPYEAISLGFRFHVARGVDDKKKLWHILILNEVCRSFVIWESYFQTTFTRIQFYCYLSTFVPIQEKQPKSILCSWQSNKVSTFFQLWRYFPQIKNWRI